MPAYSNSPWSKYDNDSRVPFSGYDSKNVKSANEEVEVKETQADINNRVYQDSITDRNYAKTLRLNGCDVVVTNGNSVYLSVFFHDQRPWDLISTDLPAWYSWREPEWQSWFDCQVYNLVKDLV